ncbi:MAG: phage tail assembly chaperone [Lysobacterales bacterium]
MASRTGPVEVTRLEYNTQAGVESPAQPELPACAEHVWFWWWELNDRRAPGFESLAPLTYAEIHHWILLTGKLLGPEEIRWLIAMDDAWLSTISEERAARQERDKEAAEQAKSKGKKR